MLKTNWQKPTGILLGTLNPSFRDRILPISLEQQGIGTFVRSLGVVYGLNYNNTSLRDMISSFISVQVSYMSHTPNHNTDISLVQWGIRIS